MTAITLRNIPPEIQDAIRERAGASGLSLSKAVLQMLEEAASLRPAGQAVLHHDLDHLAGTWSLDEATVFERSLAEQRRIDPELWD